ncbi:MAG: hypothetical protein HY675_05725 [Chloroflexi bacterium]|nr:hypothetical protein [Chloroflexota bacterium]
MYRYVDAIFSHKLLILVPIIIVTSLSVLGGILTSNTYTVSAMIWVDSSALSNMFSARGYQQPNELEAKALNEWLDTKSFLRDLVKRSGLHEAVILGEWPKASWPETTVAGWPMVGPTIQSLAFKRSTDPDALLDQVMGQVRKSLRAVAVGAYLLRVDYKGDDPELGANLVSNAIELFNERSTVWKAEQSKAAVFFLQAEVKEYEARVDTSARALRRFRETHPTPSNGIRPGAEEQELIELEKQYALDRTLYEAALGRLEQTRLVGDAELQMRQSTFRVADLPEAPKAGGLPRKGLITFTLVGIIAGLVLGLGTVITVAWADKTVRHREDLNGTTDAPVLATIPRLVAPKAGRLSRRNKDAVLQFVGTLVANNHLETRH